jgi:alkanesulfonate monooxygenase SsuD/methylene tetrahydromethanopterin reductase-like flavin-dependent oxidoreductase (luciferase family)
MADLYRRTGTAAGHDPADLEVSVASHGFIAADGRAAKELFYAHESAMYAAASSGRGFAVPPREYFDRNYAPGGMVMVGSPEEIADRLIAFHLALGHRRQIIQMDIAAIPQKDVLTSIELLGTEVLPRVRQALATHHE